MSTSCARPLHLSEKPDFSRWQAAHPLRYPAFLESATTSGQLGRYDVLLRADQGLLTLAHDGRLSGNHADAGGFIAALDAWWKAERIAREDSKLPFHGGWCLYLGYELAAELEPRLRLPAGNAPVAVAIRCPAAAIYDHLTREITLVAEHGREDLLDDIEADLHVPPPTPEPGGWIAEFAEDDPAEFLSAVRTAIGHIGRGDIYQANLSRRWAARVPLDIDYGEIYRRLRGANPGPFAGMLALAGLQVLSTSPERLVEARGGWVQTRPIAGTRPRQADDLAAVAALMDSAKERAEHVMLIDLERNDLGRVCCPGTVAVSEYCVVESYAHVHHLVSNVRGRLRPDITPGGIIRAVFPGGTITGCPKFRCMQLIAEIEGAARCAYTGSMGYLNRDGSLDLNILIRTASVADGILEIRAGAGIVADSNPLQELAETRAKAEGLLRALDARR